MFLFYHYVFFSLCWNLLRIYTVIFICNKGISLVKQTTTTTTHSRATLHRTESKNFKFSLNQKRYVVTCYIYERKKTKNTEILSRKTSVLCCVVSGIFWLCFKKKMKKKMYAHVEHIMINK